VAYSATHADAACQVLCESANCCAVFSQADDPFYLRQVDAFGCGEKGIVMVICGEKEQ